LTKRRNSSKPNRKHRQKKVSKKKGQNMLKVLILVDGSEHLASYLESVKKYLSAEEKQKSLTMETMLLRLERMMEQLPLLEPVNIIPNDSNRKKLFQRRQQRLQKNLPKKNGRPERQRQDLRLIFIHRHREINITMSNKRLSKNKNNCRNIRHSSPRTKKRDGRKI
jgi:hypothetical protein